MGEVNVGDRVRFTRGVYSGLVGKVTEIHHTVQGLMATVFLEEGDSVGSGGRYIITKVGGLEKIKEKAPVYREGLSDLLTRYADLNAKLVRNTEERDELLEEVAEVERNILDVCKKAGQY